jgi:hypothetical protein
LYHSSTRPDLQLSAVGGAATRVVEAFAALGAHDGVVLRDRPFLVGFAAAREEVDFGAVCSAFLVDIEALTKDGNGAARIDCPVLGRRAVASEDVDLIGSSSHPGFRLVIVHTIAVISDRRDYDVGSGKRAVNEDKNADTGGHKHDR